VLADRPHLWDENVPFYNAYWFLAPDRVIHLGGPGYIPLPNIVTAAALLDLDTETLVRLVRLCDRQYLHWHGEREKEKERARNQRQKQRPRGHR
jgi:hypothetical protein